MRGMVGWLFEGLSGPGGVLRGAGFYVWRCLACGVAREVITIPDDWSCPVCTRRKRVAKRRRVTPRPASPS